MKIQEIFMDAIRHHVNETGCNREEFFILTSENTLEMLIEEVEKIIPYFYDGETPQIHRFSGVEIVPDKRIPESVVVTLPIGCKGHIEEHIKQIQEKANEAAGNCKGCGLNFSADLVGRGGVIYCPFCERENYINEVLGDEF